MTPLSPARVVACLKQLPSLPMAVAEVLAQFGNEDAAVEQLAHLIARDQALTARVLRVANSSFYGLQSRVGTIQEAVVVLGFRAVRNLVLALGMNSVFRVGQCHGFDSHAYFRHGVAVGLVARILAPLARQNPDLAFTAGLLHDIGILVLAANYPGQYVETLAYKKLHDCPLEEAEQATLGMDHGEVGGILADTWHFPPPLREAVALHQTPASAAPDSIANLIHVADITAHALGLAGSPDEMVSSLDDTAWSRLGIDWETYSRVLPQIEQDFECNAQALLV